MKKGIVTLVGAGPGDKELLTLAGLKAIESAEVVVYDRLVSKEIMDLLPESAKLINVGKNVGNHPVPQEKISEILVEEAGKGRRVLRLKGGDPFLFGRGGEELELLVENAIDFKVIPGITSSIGAATYGGIPVTHRDYCSSVHMITGKGKRGTEPNINFPALVRLDGTLIFMMSVGSIDYISKGLLDAGMDPKMPCGIVENGTRTYQRKVISTLEKLSSDVANEKIKSPALIIVGRVCQLSNDFDWYSRLPLKGKRILVTQPKAKASKLGDLIKDLGGEAILYPVIKTEKFTGIHPPLDEYKLLAFTSSVGVEAFFEALIAEGRDARSLRDKVIVAVGSQTAKALQGFGILADMVPSIFDGKTMAEEIIEKGLVKKEEGILLLRAETASQEVIDVLKEGGMRFTDYPLYRTSYVDHEPIDLDKIDWITFTSKSCVEGLLETQKEESFRGRKAIAIGHQTQAMARQAGFDTIVSDEATIVSMMDKLLEIVDRNKK